MSKLLGVRFSGPLELYAEGFAAELGRLGYKPTGGIKPQLFLVAHLSRWLEARGFALSELVSPAVVEEFFAARRAAG
jgi:integrase/recombinase XerD